MLHRQGRYHETITIDDLDGSSGSAIVFTNYNNERVVVDGTTPITSAWTQVGSSNIWRTKLSADIWQLFVNWEEQVMAVGPMQSSAMIRFGIMIIIGQRVRLMMMKMHTPMVRLSMILIQILQDVY